MVSLLLGYLLFEVKKFGFPVKRGFDLALPVELHQQVALLYQRSRLNERCDHQRPSAAASSSSEPTPTSTPPSSSASRTGTRQAWCGNRVGLHRFNDAVDSQLVNEVPALGLGS